MPLDLTKAKELAEKATSGPWHIGHMDEDDSSCEIEGPDGVVVAERVARGDDVFLCFSRAFVPEAILEIEDLRDQRSRFWEEHRGEIDSLRKRLALADAVCEAVDVAGYLKHEGPHVDAWEAWRQSKGGGG